MGKKHLPHRYLTRYLLSLLLILLIPLTVLGVVLYGDVITLLEDNAAENNREKLNAVRDDFDRRLTEMAAISSAISAMDITRRSAIIPRDFLTDWNIIEELGRFSLSNDAIEEIVLYIPETETYYSSSGVYRNPYFFRDIYPFAAFSREDLEALLTADTHSQWTIFSEQKVTLANTGAANAIPAAFTVPFSSFSPYGVLLFLISTENLDQAYESYGAHGNSLLLLEDGKGNVIYRRGAGGGAVTEARAELKKFSLLFTSAVPSSLVREQVSAIQNKALISLAVIFILALFLIPYLALSGYSPIRRLIRLSNRFLPDGGETGNNELSLIGDTISDLAAQRDLINGHLDKNRRILQNHLLKGLATGRIFSPHDIGELEKELNIHLKKQQYSLFFVAKSGRGSPPVPDERTWTKGKQTIYIMKSDQALLCLMTGTLNSGMIESAIMEFLDSFPDSPSLRVFLGKTVSSLTGLHESYGEAFILKENSPAGEKLVSLNNLPDGNRPVSSAQAFFEEFTGLTGGEAAREKIGEKLENWLNPPKERLIYSLKVLELIYLLMEQKDLDSYRKELLREGVLKLSRPDPKGEENRSILSLLLDVLMFLKSREKTDLMAEIETQMELFFRDPEFSLTLLAERTGRSNAYLSRYYKEKTGGNLNKAIRQKRLAEARKLLETTEDDLETIVAAVGYYDVSSFIRLYKKETGLTPGQYRNQRKRT